MHLLLPDINGVLHQYLSWRQQAPLPHSLAGAHVYILKSSVIIRGTWVFSVLADGSDHGMRTATAAEKYLSKRKIKKRIRKERKRKGTKNKQLERNGDPVYFPFTLYFSEDLWTIIE